VHEPDNLFIPTDHRLGFIIFRHPALRQSDLETWLPRLVEMGASWLTILAPAAGIPEDFIQVLLPPGYSRYYIPSNRTKCP
jgi:hypothetical protein